MKNELFTIGPFTVYSYGFMIAVGVFAAWLTAEYRAKKIPCRYRPDIFSGVVVSGGRTSGRQAFVLDHRMERGCSRSGFYFKDNDRRICCLWRNYRRNYRRLAVQQDNKTEFPGIL